MLCPGCYELVADEKMLRDTVKIKDGRIQIKGSCPQCLNFMKWLPQRRPDQPREIYFGKYKGKTFDDVARDDPDYLRWLVENTNSDKIRDFAEEALQHVDA